MNEKNSPKQAIKDVIIEYEFPMASVDSPICFILSVWEWMVVDEVESWAIFDADFDKGRKLLIEIIVVITLNIPRLLSPMP